ncbi:MAG: hypothetical protein GY759_12980 [Chloroflexi bacterium]|nr:hypothetical protein [Chloroflexota bacterium]
MKGYRSVTDLLLTFFVATLLFSGLGKVLQGGEIWAQPKGPIRQLETPPKPSTTTSAFPRPLPSAVSERPSDFADLSIQYISRTPRYNRYCLVYDRDIPELCPGTETDQRFPQPGEPVTFTAHIVNQGMVTATAAAYTWTVDGRAVQMGEIQALGPDGWVDIHLDWHWQEGSHIVAVDLEHFESDLSEQNNQLSHQTDAHYLEILVHPYFIEAFGERENLLGTYSFADWLQAQFVQMNQRLGAALYPGTPAGIGDRIRIDVISDTVAVGGDIISSTLAFDGRWTFRTEPDYKRTPENEALESARRYAQTYAAGIDWGLIHELTHQLGVIDLYQLNVSPSAGNPLTDQEGLPLLSGFYWQWPGLMGGDDARPFDNTHYSEHTARALASNSGYRRGYFGDYLYDLPAKVRLQVLDRAGTGVNHARIEIYQTERNELASKPVIVGDSDESGFFLLPNRPVTATMTTETGHTLHANPFAHIDVVGRNGQLLIRVQNGGQEFYRWLPITELNKHFWNGNQIETITLHTYFPPDSGALPPAPANLSLRTGATRIFAWDPVAEAVSYNLYGAVWPDYDPFALVVEGLTEPQFATRLSDRARYAVTAVDGAGRESAYSNIARAETLLSPYGLIWRDSYLADQGELLVVDGHRGAMLHMLPPAAAGQWPRWLGRVGSEHHGMVDAVQANLGRDDAFAVALRGSGRVWVMDDRQDPLNWFGRINDLPSELASPGGVALTGEPFTVDFSPTRPDADAALLLPFDGDLLDANGTAPVVKQGLSFTDGRFGQAVEIGQGARLQYAAGDFNATRGGVEFWFRPTWSGPDKKPHVLLEIGDPGREPGDGDRGYRLRVAHTGGGLYAWVSDFEDIDKAAWGDIAGWEAGEWHHVAAVWQEQRISLFVDGRLAWGEALPFAVEGEPAVIAIGGTLAGEHEAMGAFDALRVSTVPRSGNSDQVRVLVSERQTAEVKVLDLMGNLISTWVPDDDGLHGFGQLVVDPSGRVFMADTETADVVELKFDGDSLHSHSWLGLALQRGPLALAVSRDGWLAIGDRSRVRLFNPDQPSLVPLQWMAPTGGSEDNFDGISALAFGPDGDLAIADMGALRIRFIHDPISWRQFMGLVLVGR